MRLAWTAPSFAVLTLLAGCGPDYSPNTYSVSAVQQANKVQRGEIIGVRAIDVSSSGMAGAATGAAAGGAIGGAAGSTGTGAVTTALGAIGGGLVGGLLGTSVEHATADTSAFEYVVREFDKDQTLVSVTQKDAVPLKIGTKVLVIGGNQARIVPDYTVDPDASKASATAPATPTTTAPPADAPTALAPGTPAGSSPAAAPTAPTALGTPAPPTTTEPSPAPVATAPLPAPAPAATPSAPAATP